MNYDFYASRSDQLALLDHLFTETDLLLYDLYSPYGEEVQQYRSTAQVTPKFDREFGAAHFQLWSPRFGAEPEVIHVPLNPRYCEGHTFRYRTSGWGLIQLYFGAQQQNRLAHSHIGHYNEKGALAQEAGCTKANGPVAEWNWSEINSTSRKLKYLLHNKWSVRKLGSTGVLAGAAELEQQGIVLSR